MFQLFRPWLSRMLFVLSFQKWKAFAAKVETMTKALKKKDTAGALKDYQEAMAALNEYLEQVELPPVK